MARFHNCREPAGKTLARYARWAQLELRGPQFQTPSFFFRISFTTPGFAFPPVAFIV
jgi:hypothetical protein